MQAVPLYSNQQDPYAEIIAGRTESFDFDHGSFFAAAGLQNNLLKMQTQPQPQLQNRGNQMQSFSGFNPKSEEGNGPNEDSQ